MNIPLLSSTSDFLKKLAGFRVSDFRLGPDRATVSAATNVGFFVRYALSTLQSLGYDHCPLSVCLGEDGVNNLVLSSDRFKGNPTDPAEGLEVFKKEILSLADELNRLVLDPIRAFGSGTET